MDTQTASSKGSTPKKDVYAIVTNRIIDQLENGTVPWRQPWKDAGVPRNFVSGRPYRGINVMLLSMLGYEQNVFLTAKQLKQIGGSIIPEEDPHLVVYWNYTNATNENTGDEVQKKKPFLRYYKVYNIAQCAGIVSDLNVETTIVPEPIPSCEKIVAEMPLCPKIRHKEDKAYYEPMEDFINMPKPKAFESMESYYCTLFHELVHSTGHHSRLNRMGLVQMSEFGSTLYSQEELVAEIGACYLQSYVGITEQFEQSVAYINGWLKVLRAERHFIITAASLAQKAIDYILNVQAMDAEQAEE